MSLLLVLACQTAPPPPAVAPSAVWVDAQHVDSGAHIQLHAPEGATVEGDNGLVVAPKDSTTWDLSGKDGSYILKVSSSSGAVATRLFVDIGVKGPSGGEMDDLAAPPPPPAPMWPWILGFLGGTLVASLLARWAWQRWKPVAPPLPPDPAHVIARRAWAALRERQDLVPEEVARAMSEIFRTWIDAAWGFPATRRTTREILDNLAGSLTAAELDAARRLLSATDLVKFAERNEYADLFAKLDRDFEALVRPVSRA